MLPPIDVHRLTEALPTSHGWAPVAHLDEVGSTNAEAMDRARAEEVVEMFLDAAESGDADALVALMTPDVVLTSDSNGKATAVRQPMRGAPAVMQVLSGFARIGAVLEDYRAEFVVFNGQPGMILYFDGRLQTAITLRVVDDLIVDIYVMRNPDKLVGVELRRPVTR